MAWWNQWLRGFNNLDVKEEFDPEKDPGCLAFKLIEKGFHFNVEKDWYERTWMVATRDGAETSKEVYQKRGEHWKVTMFGNDGSIFFEHNVGENG